VGARRQVRTLGLVAASGGEPKDVKRIVLAEGVVLGFLGALIGAALGIVAGRASVYSNKAGVTAAFVPLDRGMAIVVVRQAGR
jgi:putative ABC transport system permease protein